MFEVRDYDDKLRGWVNPQLIAKMKVSLANLECIKALHLRRYHIFDEMRTLDEESMGYKKIARPMLKELTQIEFDLQEAWGFPKDSNFHRFWDIPGCTCPTIDNNERIGTGYFIINGGCPLHGGDIGKEKSEEVETGSDTAA
jgi:hypothetical protein